MRHALILSSVLAAVTLAACAGSSRQENANKELVRAFAAAVNAADWAALEPLVAEDFVRHSQATAGAPVTSRDGFIRLQQGFLASFPDQRVTLEALVAELDRVAVIGRYTGTNSGPLGGAAASGRSVDSRFLSVFRIEEGRIAEMWVEWDNLSLLSQLGLPPPVDARSVLDAFLAAHRAGDIEALLRMHTGDAMFTVNGRPPRSGWEALRRVYAWDTTLGTELRLGAVTADRDLLRIDEAVKRDRLLEALGVDELRYSPGMRVKLRGALIQGIYMPELTDESQAELDEALAPVVAWLDETDPETLERLLPDGRFRCDGANAARWLEVLAAWRGEAAAAPAVD